MNATAARHEAHEILPERPARISDVIKPFARQSPDHPALVQGDVTWTYADLAAIVARTAITLADYGVRPGDRVMIVSENSLALAAILLATSEIDAWSVVVNPRLSDREIDLIRDHSGARRVFYTIEVSDHAPACEAPRRRHCRTLRTGYPRHRLVERADHAGTSRGRSVAPGHRTPLSLGHDRQSQGGEADSPQCAVQRQGSRLAARRDASG